MGTDCVSDYPSNNDGRTPVSWTLQLPYLAKFSDREGAGLFFYITMGPLVAGVAVNRDND